MEILINGDTTKIINLDRQTESIAGYICSLGLNPEYYFKVIRVIRHTKIQWERLYMIGVLGKYFEPVFSVELQQKRRQKRISWLEHMDLVYN